MESQQTDSEKLVKITKELTCSICTYIMDDPSALHCGHSFCGVCIHEWLGNSKTCPMCRVPIVRQPVHVTALQELADLIRTTPSSRKRLVRENWVSLFPIQNNITFIVDEDEDGIIHRCSQCSWELTEDNYCVRCEIQYDGALPIRNNHIGNRSDPDSDMDGSESNLEDFVVSDDQVEYEAESPPSFNRRRRNTSSISDDSDIESLAELPSVALSDQNSPDTIEISDDDDAPLQPRSSRKRRIELPSDDETDGLNSDDNSSECSDSESEVVYINSSTHGERDSDFEEDEDEYEDDFPDDPFPRPNRYIDDFAEEDDDDDEEETPRSKPQKVDRITENINRARSQMQTNTKNNTKSISNNASNDESSDTNDDSDAPDYEFMSSPLKPSPASSSVQKPSPPTTKTAVAPPPQPQTEQAASNKTSKNKSKEKRKKEKKDKKSKKNKTKRDKKKHKAHE